MATKPNSKAALPLSKTWHGATYDGDVGFSHSDLVIKCQGHEFKVQKSAVCPQSPILAAQMHGNWHEPLTRMIEVEQFDAGTIARLLHYLYFVDYSTDATSKYVLTSALDCAETNRILLVHARVTAAADYYQIADLKKFAAQSFLDAAEKWSSLGFSEVIQVVYSLLTSKDRSLKDTVRDVTICHWREVKSSTWFKNTMTSCGQFAYEIMRAREKIHDTAEGEVKALKAQIARDHSILQISEDDETGAAHETNGKSKKRKKLSSNSQPVPECQSSRPNLSIGEGFESDELPRSSHKHGLRKPKKQMEKEGYQIANVEAKVPATAYVANYLNDCGVESNGDSKIWPVNPLGRFEYMTADKKHGVIEPSKVKKIEWAKDIFHVRLTGLVHTGKTYEVRIILEDENSFHDFRADCIGLRVVDPAKSSNWQEQSG